MHAELVREPFPAGSAFQVAVLPFNASVEIEPIVVVDQLAFSISWHGKRALAA